MGISSRINELHISFRQNRWLWLFTIFTRLMLVAGFLGPGIVKILGERFTDLHNNQPMGHYLEALFHTGYYYTFIGFLQVLAAVLLLFPRTVILGVLIYLPIILNICILSFSVRFEGSLFTSPLMVIANIYLLCWHYDRVKYILPFRSSSLPCALPKQQMNNKFPFVFFAGVAATFVAVLVVTTNMHDVMPRNTFSDCMIQFEGGNRSLAGNNFCDCVHNSSQTLDACLEEYENSSDNNTGLIP